MIENKLGLKTESELALDEERISKKKAYEIFEKDYMKILEVGTFFSLSNNHQYLFEDIYDYVVNLEQSILQKAIFDLHHSCI